MFSFVKVKFVVGVLIGAIGGYAWYHIIGCNTGSCPITSNPYTSVLYGMVMGGLISSV